MKNAVFYFLLFSSLAVASFDIKAATFPASYQATYTVSRGGKAMAEQTTTFKSVSPNQYTLTDVTKGTHGLASFTGFERTETTHFQFEHNQTIAVEHNMQQKVAFKSKSYQFKALATENTISGQGKQAFTLETTIKPISSHMLPLWLSIQACDDTKQLTNHINVPVLKSKRIKIYEFSIIDESPQLYRVDRIYPTDTQRSSQIWLDKNKQCLPIKTQHREPEEPVIETNLSTHKLIKL
ncbi:hypothetical protein MNBD_GAMMA02-824 [hydrothermal vent metagenome]|uniref:DUF3108 domain-containing protein n=1 Tax=hydrothermal vent metagenome TaxID=652676 RepID=A0A3B0VWL3_9ZZZZ